MVSKAFCFVDDSSADPSKSDAPDSLLDGGDSTIKDMLTGMHVIAPEPEYPDDHIPPFNAHDAMYIEITKDEVFPAKNPSPEENAWLPTTTDWKGAKKAWSSPSETAKQAVAAEWARVFGWVDKIVGSSPAVLVDKFEEVYLSVPGITSA